MKIIIVFLGSFLEDATCNLDFKQGKDYRYKSAGPTEEHQQLLLSSVTSVTVLDFSLMFTKETLSPELGMCWCCPWEASRMTRKQICKFCNFSVAHLHTRYMCICQGYLHGSMGPGRWRCTLWSHPHTRKGVKCCCTVLGKWGLLARGTRQIWTRATSLHEVLPAGKRRETWEVWTLSLELNLNAVTLSLFTA